MNKKLLGGFSMILAVFTAILMLNPTDIYSDSSIDTEATLKYLRALENRDVTKIEKEINKENGYDNMDFNIKRARKYYEDTVFMGDSVTEYLSEANILRSSSVLAVKGDTVTKVFKKVKILKQLKPNNIVMLYGTNDMESYSAKVFKERYIKLIKEIKRILPKVNIYIQEPLQVNEALSTRRNKNITNANLEKYRIAAKEVAKETKVRFLPSKHLIEDKSLYEQDGIHLKYNFYKVWLQYLSDII